MAYVALYRAHRPQKFSEVAGQKHIVKTLQNAIKLNKVAHAYLFCGPRGTGKTSLAKIFAKALNCQDGSNIEPCNVCSHCVEITKGMITDVVEIDAASNNGVDDIRDLRDKIRLSPIIKYKIYIIDEVHMLSTGAFNALLKTLEEPPAHAIFILATTEPHKIPATILSRCQRFDFQSVSQLDIFNRIQEVSKIESINITEDALHAISEVCDGGMRDALSLLDQSISYANSDIIQIDDILNVSGNVNRDIILEILNSCLSNDGAKTIKTLHELLQSGKELTRIVNDLISFLRDVLLFKNDSLDDTKGIYKNEDFKDFAYGIKPNVIYSWLKTLNEVFNNMKFSNQKQAFLELGLLTMSDKLTNDYAFVLDKISELERTIDYMKENVQNNPVNNNNNHFNYNHQVLQPSTSFVEDNMVEPEEPVKQPEKIQTNEDEFITVDMIEDILNNGDKNKKEELSNLWQRLLVNNSNNTLIQILCRGNIVACNDNTCLITLMDETFCNRLMKYDNFEKILPIINKDSEVIKDYICIPQNIWNSIRLDYSNKYKLNPGSKIQLDNIKIPIKKHIKQNGEVKQDPFVLDAIDLFGEENIKIKED